MDSKKRSLLFACLGLLFGMGIMYIYNNFTIQKKNIPEHEEASNYKVSEGKTNQNSVNIYGNIDELTEENKVINYVKEHHELPEYYITKSEAKKQGWIPSKGNLCEVLPGRAIGGDHFSNREKTLPKNAQYYEADVNYNCGNRNADRIVFTKKGDVYLTKDHYKTFEEK